jgi:hypothetical protein
MSEQALNKPQVWHDAMHRWEQELLDVHIQRFKILQAFELEDSPFAYLLSTHI